MGLGELSMTGILQAADDIVRLVANGLTFGMADKVAQAAGTETPQQSAAKNKAALDRAGLAGDLAGVVGGGKALVTGLPLAAKGVRAVAAPAMRAVGRNKMATAGAAGAALLAGANYNERTGGNASAVPKAQAAAPAKPAAGAKPKAAPKPAEPQGVPVSQFAPSFDTMAAQLAAAQGGQISLNQLAALSEINQRLAPKASSRPKVGDAAGAELEAMILARHKANMENTQLTPEQKMQAAQQFREDVLELRKSSLIDPYGLSGPQFGE